jgi:Ca-activated chloride channel family protein
VQKHLRVTGFTVGERGPTHGERGTVQGRLVDVRREGDGTVAVEVESAGGRGWVVFDAESPGRAYDWDVDRRYRIANVVGCDRERALRTREERVEEGLSTVRGIELLEETGTTVDTDACPECGGAVDVADAVRLADPVRDRIEELSGSLYGIGRASLSVEALGSTVDDWRPRSDQRPTGVDDDPTVVCLDCGTDVTAYYRERVAAAERDARADDGGGMADIVDEALENPEQAMASRGSVDASGVESRLGDLGYAAGGSASSTAAADVGMATGGAKDANNFRDNVHEGYVPMPDSLAYEGLFYDYYFETGDGRPGGDAPGGEPADQSDPADEGLFYPSYARAVTESPLSGERERYLTVGLNSTLTEADLERKPLNLVAVVDVSGSMDSRFDQYYYDEHGNRREVEADGEDESKMAAARRALSALTEQLRDEDCLGVVLYSSEAHVAKPLRRVGETDMDAIRGHVAEIRAGGGTNMAAGFDAAMDLLESHHGADLTEVENRVVFMTDAMPNRGATGEADIVERFQDAADRHVHTTFIGIGLDANADLVESISGVRGANHYFVHSTAEFEERLGEEFTYMVTPLVFDLSLDVVSDGYEIEAVYGSPDAARATGEVMHVTTLFPSPTSGGETRGGVTLLELRETDSDSNSDPDPSIELVANWVERDGTQGQTADAISFPAGDAEHFDDTGVRKAVFLSRYGRLLREWIGAVRATDDESDVTDEEANVADEGGIDDWQSPAERELGAWEEQSVPLRVPVPYREEFETFREHALREIEHVGDETLARELDVLELLSDPDAVERARTGDGDGDEGEATDDAGDSPDACPNCGTDLSNYGSGPLLCPECGATIG